MNFIASLIIVACFITICIEVMYFRKQKRKCQKYAFYKLRDEVICEIASTDDYKEHLKVYRAINDITIKIKFLSFNFYQEALIKALGKMVDDLYKNNFKSQKEFLEKNDFSKLPVYQKKLIQLVAKTAKDNSLLLRMFMTKIGFKILFTTSLVRAFKRFLTNHPEILRKKRPKIKTIQGYSAMNQMLPV